MGCGCHKRTGNFLARTGKGGPVYQGNDRTNPKLGRLGKPRFGQALVEIKQLARSISEVPTGAVLDMQISLGHLDRAVS
jgi:hypothetical protein